MLALLKKLRDDECGFVVSSELILIMTIVCLGMVVGLTEVSNAVIRPRLGLSADSIDWERIRDPTRPHNRARPPLRL